MSYTHYPRTAPETATLIRPNGEQEEIKVSTLEDFQKAVGGYIEPVSCYDDDGNLYRDYVMLVNDEGRINGLPYNSVASWMTHRTISGDVLIVHKTLLD